MPSKFMVRMLLVGGLLCMSAFGQLPGRAVQDDPRALVTSFWRQEVQGKRLTMEGWNDLTDLCVQQPLFPDAVIVHVISRNSLLDENEELRTEDFASFYTDYKEYGTIDGKLRFLWAPGRTPSGVKIGSWGSHIYAILTKEIDPKGNRPTGRKIWKILEPPLEVSVEVSAAIEYVRRARATAKDPTTRNNAARALQTLVRLQKAESSRRHTQDLTR